jgi:hypothetical protein
VVSEGNGNTEIGLVLVWMEHGMALDQRNHAYATLEDKIKVGESQREWMLRGSHLSMNQSGTSQTTKSWQTCHLRIKVGK